MSNRIDQQLVLAALHMALAQRSPRSDLLHHSDQGRQYLAEPYQGKSAAPANSASMGCNGNCYDNAVVESVFGTLKTNRASLHLLETETSDASDPKVIKRFDLLGLVREIFVTPWASSSKS